MDRMPSLVPLFILALIGIAAVLVAAGGLIGIIIWFISNHVTITI